MSELVERLREQQKLKWMVPSKITGEFYQMVSIDDLCEAADRIEALEAKEAAGQWQDIATCPTDVEFLAYMPSYLYDGEDEEVDGFVEVCEKWSDGSIIGKRTHSQYLDATHWKPLDIPPKPI